MTETACEAGRYAAGPRLGWFLAWAAAGAAWCVALFSFGILVIPVIAAATVVLRRHPLARRSWPGLVTGAGVPILALAYANRHWPDAATNPWRLLVIGAALVCGGVLLIAGNSSSSQRPHRRSAGDSRAVQSAAIMLPLALLVIGTVMSFGPGTSCTTMHDGGLTDAPCNRVTYGVYFNAIAQSVLFATACFLGLRRRFSTRAARIVIVVSLVVFVIGTAITYSYR